MTCRVGNGPVSSYSESTSARSAVLAKICSCRAEGLVATVLEVILLHIDLCRSGQRGQSITEGHLFDKRLVEHMILLSKSNTVTVGG